MASSSRSSPLMEASEVPNWLELPREVMATILLKVGAVDILMTAQRVCTMWREICKEPGMWRSIDMVNLCCPRNMDCCDLEKMARHAVDRSCGQLVHFNIEYFGTDDLLQYITERAPQLKHLRLVCCHSISDKGLSEAAKKLPLLEELHIYFGSVSKEALETVGYCCPRLKSLEFNIEDDEEEALAIAANMPNNLGLGDPDMDPDAEALAIVFQEAQAFANLTNNLGSMGPQMERDDEALAIAATMPGLRHLQLFGNKMTNKGLQAILDGCPHLQSLDIRKCFNVHLGESLGKRCSEQIKDLRLPDDSTDGFGFDATFHDWYGYDSFDDVYPSWFSEIDILSDINEYYEFSGGSELSDYEEVVFDD